MLGQGVRVLRGHQEVERQRQRRVDPQDGDAGDRGFAGLHYHEAAVR